MHRPSAWFILLILVSVAPLRADTLNETPPEHIQAYVSLIRAGREEKNGNLREALALYREGMTGYEEVASRYPSWQPEMVQYRLAQSRNQIMRLQEALASVAPPALPDMPAATPAVEVRVETDPLLLEEVAILEASVAELEEERAGLVQRIQDLEHDQAARQEEHAAVTQNLQRASQQATEQALQLQQENERLRQDIEDLQRAMQEAIDTRDAQSADAAGARAGEVGALREQLAVLEAAQQEQDAERDALLQQMSVAAGSLAQAQDELAVARASEVDLRAERDLLGAEVAALRAAAENQTAQDSAVDELSARAQALQEQLDQAQSELARRKTEFESAVKMNQEFDRTRRQLEDERNRLTVELQQATEKQSIAAAGSRQVGELNAAIQKLKSDNRDLQREIDGLNKTLDRRMRQDDPQRLQTQNLALTEELRVYRARLAAAEKRIRELEAGAAARGQPLITPINR